MPQSTSICTAEKMLAEREPKISAQYSALRKQFPITIAPEKVIALPVDFDKPTSLQGDDKRQ